MEFLFPYSPRRNREKPDDSIRQTGTADGTLSGRLDLNENLMYKLKDKVSLTLEQKKQTIYLTNYKI